MRFLSLFAGIGGFDLGLERAGFECAGQVEINPFCQKVLAKHWPNVKRIGDIREVKGNEFGAIDLVCGGFPCQPFSTAGKRKGKSDARYLWPEMLRVINTIKPSWIIGENVKGLITLGLDTICDELENEGYAVQTMCIPACSIGAVHRRERLFILANSASYGLYKGETTRSDVSTNDTRRKEEQEKNSKHERCGCFRNVLDGYCNQIGTWGVEPPEIRVDDGLPNRMDRIKALGNAVVPQIVEIIGRAIKAGALHYSLQKTHGGQSVLQARQISMCGIRYAKRRVKFS